MQNYPDTREGDDTDWLDPLIERNAKKTVYYDFAS